MLFTQLEFYIFIVILLSLLGITKKIQGKKIILLLANYYFYSYWDYRFLILIVFSSLSDFLIGKSIESAKTTSGKKFLLLFSIVLNLGILGFFKYYNFFITTINNIRLFNITHIHTLNLILPLGISFYTFRLISYVVDVYRGKITACNNLIDFAIYVAFFPIIVSGPIARASSFLPQLNSLSISFHNLYAGFRLFIIGLFLKVFIADSLGIYVDYYYSNYSVFNTITSWIAICSYSLQIYCDFAGYSSMAIGLAQMLGIRIEDNFNFPYISTSISEFWRRWHITLSTWIKDYIYIPLGGNRKGKSRTKINLLVTMILCGLWHGAAWTFVLWGAVHGLLLVINRYSRDIFQDVNKKFNQVYSITSGLLTFLAVTLAWVIFRAADISQALSIYQILIFPRDGVTYYSPFVIFILMGSLLFHLFHIYKFEFITLPVNSKYTLFALCCMIWLVIVFYPRGFHPFVYLQF